MSRNFQEGSGYSLQLEPFIEYVRERRGVFCLLASVALFMAALARYWVQYDPNASLPRDPESLRLAYYLATRDSFANPFFPLDTGFSAHLAPLYPGFLAVLIRMFGDNSAGLYAAQLALAFVLALQLALYPVISNILGMGQLNGFVGASLWIIARPRVQYEWESLYAALFVLVACCCYRRYLKTRPHSHPALAWYLGAFMGLLILLIPTVLMIYLTWIAAELWYQKRAFLRKSLVPLVVLPLAVLTPWTIRNYTILHGLVFVRDNFGMELSVSNNDCAKFGLLANILSGCFDSMHPNRNATEASKVLALGEFQYNREREKQAVNWISNHPWAFGKLCVMRFAAFWMPTETFTVHYASSQGPLERITIYFMTLLSGLGLVLLWRRDSASAAILASCLAAFPMIYYLVQFEYRYRYPIMWVTFLLGAMPITFCGKRLFERSIRGSSHMDRVVVVEP